ncbi:hypothetical protein B0H14DRAFT_972011 [Mycena olivaceomarginata]|nr:hypothetical protein B0H14DRAFT_972011 [Mycena olivaceomarginata]
MLTDWYIDKDPQTGEKLWYRDNPEATSSGSKAHKSKPKPKKLLPARFRNLFDNKMVVCVEYDDLEDSDEGEIFRGCLAWFGFFVHMMLNFASLVSGRRAEGAGAGE